MRLNDLATIKTNFKDADFWLIRKGSIKTVGSVTRTYEPQHIGVKVVRTDILLPDYLYYCMMHIQSSGQWGRTAYGTLSLVHIRVADVKHITLSPS